MSKNFKIRADRLIFILALLVPFKFQEFFSQFIDMNSYLMFVVLVVLGIVAYQFMQEEKPVE